MFKSKPKALKDFENLPPLTEGRIDNFLFQVTSSPFEPGSCVLWLRDADKEFLYSALGKFKSFDRRRCLEFMVKYSTSPELREELERRRFERRAQALQLSYLRQLEAQSKADREKAYRSLFDLDSDVELAELSRRRRAMTKRFHPDAGGDHKAMALINEAYEYLAVRSKKA
jgi:hypothetical protein